MQAIRSLSSPSHQSTDRRRRVLALCGDTQVGLWMLRSLARRGLTVFALCNSPQGQAAHSRYCAGAWVLDQGDGAASRIDQIEQLVRQLDLGSIMPISESYHAALIASRQRFEPDVHIFSPPGEAFAKATDKSFLHALCQDLHVPVAKGTTLDQFVATGGDGLRYPLVLRTRRQNDPGAPKAPWKAAYARDAAGLERLHRNVKEYAENVLVQEYHPGVEAHVQILMHEGEAFMAGEYLGQYHMPLAGGVTVQRVSCRHEPLIDDAVRILKALQWQGIAAAQFHYDPQTDRYIFLEINPRFCGGLPTVIMAGFEAPFLLWQSHFEPEKLSRAPYRLGLRTRILGGHANWLLAMLRHDPLPPDQKHLSRLGAVARFAWNFGPWTKDDCFAWTDPKPFFVDVKQMVQKRLRKTGKTELLDLS